MRAAQRDAAPRFMGCAQSKTATARRGDVRLGDDDDATTTTTEVRVKLVLLGASGAGKTALSTRFVRGTFDGENASATVGAAFASTTRALDDARARIKFEIWDTAGQERYASLAPLYYRGATAAMIAFDARDGASFERARYWAEELRKHGDARCRVLLVGNKIDAVRDDERATAREACEALAREYGMAAYRETSAKTGEGVQEAFEDVARAVMTREMSAREDATVVDA